MTSSDFRVALRRLGIPQKKFAEMTGYRPETISRWACGHETVPRNVALIVSLLAERFALTRWMKEIA